ncbi:MAG: response regulator transcription factor [Alphaproteobacteria bacterium]
MKILLVEDDNKLGEVIIKVLKKQNYFVDWAKNAEECFEYIDYNKENIYDIILLDWMLPQKNGDEICQELRLEEKYNFQNGIIFLTAKDDINDIVKGLDVGADDYVVKPFENVELIARINSVSRRKAKQYNGNLEKFGNTLLNKTEHLLSVNKKEVGLSRTEFLLFDLLFNNKNKLVSRLCILENVWSLEENISQASIDSYIYILRKKLKKIESNLSISLHKDYGYTLETKND